MICKHKGRKILLSNGLRLCYDCYSKYLEENKEKKEK